jgi:hypothetical protein
MKNPNFNPGDMVRSVLGDGAHLDPYLSDGCVGTLVKYLGHQTADVRGQQYVIPDCWKVDWADGHSAYVAQKSLRKIQPGDDAKKSTFVPGSWDKCPWDPVNGDKTEDRVEENVDEQV